MKEKVDEETMKPPQNRPCYFSRVCSSVPHYAAILDSRFDMIRVKQDVCVGGISEAEALRSIDLLQVK